MKTRKLSKTRVVLRGTECVIVIARVYLYNIQILFFLYPRREKKEILFFLDAILLKTIKPNHTIHRVHSTVALTIPTLEKEHSITYRIKY